MHIAFRRLHSRTLSTSDALDFSAATCIVVDGSLTFTQSANLTMHMESSETSNSMPITVTGTATLSGTLVLVLPTLPPDNESVPLITAGALRGNFSQVRATHSAKPCVKVHASQVTSGNTLSVLFRVQDSCKKKGLGAAAIAGIVVGGVVALSVAALMVLLALRKWRVPQADFLYRDLDDADALR